MGYASKSNPRTQAAFECQSCGHTDNADINASLDITALAINACGLGDHSVVGPGRWSGKAITLKSSDLH